MGRKEKGRNVVVIIKSTINQILTKPEASKMPASVLVIDSTIVELRLKQQAELPRIQAPTNNIFKLCM